MGRYNQRHTDTAGIKLNAHVFPFYKKTSNMTQLIKVMTTTFDIALKLRIVYVYELKSIT